MLSGSVEAHCDYCMTQAQLLGLPAEIKHRVYNLCIPEHLPHYLAFAKPGCRDHCGPYRVKPPVPYPRPPALSRVCRRLRDEVLSIFYGERDVVVSPTHGNGQFHRSDLSTLELSPTWRLASRYTRKIQLNFFYPRFCGPRQTILIVASIDGSLSIEAGRDNAGAADLSTNCCCYFLPLVRAVNKGRYDSKSSERSRLGVLVSEMVEQFLLKQWIEVKKWESWKTLRCSDCGREKLRYLVD